MAAMLSLLAMPAIAGKHNDDWCADAVDFAMGAAQNMEIGYPLATIVGSIDRNPSYFQRMFETLSADDMKQITGTVYENGWSRFQAAQGMTESCEPEDRKSTRLNSSH